MAKQIKLLVEEENNMSIFGIISQENDLKVTWSINKELGLKLARIDNIMNPKSLNVEGFPAYLYDDEKNQIKYTLIVNKISGVSFATSLKNVDYILVLKGIADKSEIKNFMMRLKQLPVITTAIEIDSSTVKERDIITMF